MFRGTFNVFRGWIMNPKIVFAFLGGAALASGIVYVAVKPDTKPVTKTLYVEPVKRTAADKQAEPATAQVEQKSPVVFEETRPTRRERDRVVRQPVRPRYEPPKLVARAASPVTTTVVQPAPVTPPPAAPAVATPPAPPANPEPVSTPAPVPEAPKAPPPQPHTVTLTAGTQLPVRVGETLTTQRAKPGDTFMGTLDTPLVIDDFVIAERGSRCEGRVVESDPGGRVKGVARLSVELTSLHTADGQKIRLRTTPFAQDAEATRKTDAAKVGGGAALGAIIGAIAGGGKGAAVGAGAGGAAGAGDVMLTRGKPAEIKVETRVIFRVQDPVTITERLQQ
jgi:hypothetical protein